MKFYYYLCSAILKKCFAAIAQLVEHFIRNEKVVGSSPTRGSSTILPHAQSPPDFEHFCCKVGVCLSPPSEGETAKAEEGAEGFGVDRLWLVAGVAGCGVDLRGDDYGVIAVLNGLREYVHYLVFIAVVDVWAPHNF